MTSRLITRGGGVAALASFSLNASADYALNLQQPVNPIAHQIYDLHTLILWVCLGIFIVVFGTMFYSILNHRKSLGHKAAHFHENTTVEVIWTIIPFFILIGMAWPATKTVLAMKDTTNPDMTVKITGYQWKWEYDYQKEGIHFFSMLATPRDQIENKANKDEHYLLEVDNMMVVPTGKKIRLLLTADDVIHSWWVPAFGVKQDAIPGFIHDTWFEVDKPGIYRGQCAELCGKDHGFMPIVVEAKTPEDYAKWVDEQKAKSAAAVEDPNKVYDMADMLARGEKVYAANCAACHQANGQGIPGAFPPLIDGAAYAAAPEMTAALAQHGFWKGGKIVLGPKDQHIAIVMHGVPGTAMQAFGKQLSATDLAAVVTYERNSWGNKTGDLIQPSEIQALNK
jgi:cytochrome c oxidase subunit 2